MRLIAAAVALLIVAGAGAWQLRSSILPNVASNAPSPASSVAQQTSPATPATTPDGAPSTPVATTPTVSVQPAPPSSDDVQWDLLKDTTDIQLLRRFIEQNPSSKHLADAERLFAALTAQLPPVVQPIAAAPVDQSNLQATATPVPAPAAVQPSALAEPQPAGPSAAQQADGLFTEQDMQRVNAVAAKDQLVVMPQFKIERPDGKLPAALRKFVGIWASDIGFEGGGRHAMLIITNVEAPARASGFYVWGSPSARSPYKFPAGIAPFDGTIAGDKLTFKEDRYDMTATFGSGGSFAMAQKLKDGTTLKVTAKPVWRLLDAERTAKR
jgi:hypothetical protein